MENIQREVVNEEWRDAPNIPGYQVSNLGQVKSLQRDSHDVVSKYSGKLFKRVVREKRLKFFGDRYLRVPLSVSGKSLKFCVHRLVALAFVPNPNNLPQVNHIDGNKFNNAASNLEWVTCKENVNHAFDNGLNNQRRFSPEDISTIRRMLAEGVYQRDIAKQFNVSRSCILNIRLGTTYAGFTEALRRHQQKAPA